MDPELFKQRLTEVAEWRIPKSQSDINPLTKKRGRGRPSKESQDYDQNEREFLEQHGGVNPTYPPQLVRVKTQSVDCGDCGRHCENGRHTERKVYVTQDLRHWREHCQTCKMSRNPYTQKFDLTMTESSVIWNQWVREQKISKIKA